MKPPSPFLPSINAGLSFCHYLLKIKQLKYFRIHYTEKLSPENRCLMKYLDTFHHNIEDLV